MHYCSSTLVLLIFSLVSLSAQTTFWVESFETDGNGSRYTPSVEVLPSGSGASCNDHFARNLPTNGCSGDLIDNDLGSYTSLDGSYLWAGEDLDDGGVGGSGGFVQSITFNNIPSISGKVNLAFRGLFGTGAAASFDNRTVATANPDFLVVEYRLDGGSYQEVLAFHPTFPISDVFNTPMAQDTDSDQLGDGTVLTNALGSFIAPITGTGNTLELRVSMSSNSAREEMAFDFFELLEDFVILPVDWVSFTAKPLDKQVQLHWEVADGFNNASYYIEYSFDGRSFREIGFQNPLPEEAIQATYYFIHEPPAGSQHFYRIRQQDVDGTVSYSPIQKVALLTNEWAPTVYPNPFQRTTTIQWQQATDQVVLRIFDLDGRRLEQFEVQDQNTFQLSMDQYPTGAYLLQVQSSQGISYQRLIRL